jgi:hypothetical protein
VLVAMVVSFTVLAMFNARGKAWFQTMRVPNFTLKSGFILF